MRAGVASVHISSTSQLSTGVVESDDVLDGSVVNADINAAAGIKFSKLDSAAIDAALLPDGNSTRDLGSNVKFWRYLYTNYLYCTRMFDNPVPNADNAQSFGSAAYTWQVIYTNDIQGAARGLIMTFGLLGD